MDKIDFARWNDYFGSTRQETLFSNDRYSEHVFSFSEKGLLTGEIRTLAAPGFTLTELHLQAARPFQFLDTAETEGAESLFVLNGEVESVFPSYPDPLRFSSQRQSLQYNTNFSGSHTIFSPQFHAMTVSYDLCTLEQMLHSDDGPASPLLESIRQKRDFLSAPYSLAVSGRVAEVIHAMRRCPFGGSTRYVFMESKMMELLVLQMELLQSIKHEGPAGNWSPLDREKLHATKEYIERGFLEPLSLKELTSRFGLNEFKLKKGFKDLFDTTVFGHVHHLRMQKAKALLAAGELNVSDVAFFIGYDNVSSFSTAFKKRFGYPPRMQSGRLMRAMIQPVEN